VPITQGVLRMLASRLGRHRLELVIAVCAVAALIAVAASTRTTTRTFARGESWRHATGSLAALTASSHVWLEEIFAGDTSNDPQRDILAPLARAHGLCDALRAGGTTPMGRIEPVQPANRARVAALCDDLVVLTALTRRRLAAPETSAAGSAIDGRYDAVFKRIERNADRLGNDLAATVRSERSSVRDLNEGVLVSLLVLFATMGLMGRRHVRERLVRQRLEALARTDPLTGVANHRHFHERLRAELDRAGRDSSKLALVVLDVDHFTGLNDDRGHRFGDRVLSEIAATIAAAVRASDLVARLGGGRFAVLLPGSGGRDAGVIADALRARVAQVRPDGCAVTASAGVAAVPADATAAAALLEAADGALAWAKRDGRDCTRRFDPAHVRSRSLQRRRAEILALLDGEGMMRPVFQPLVDLATCEVAGYEALTRFPGSDLGPDHWFEEARRCGLGGALEARAIALALAAPDRPRGAFVSLNVSPSGLLSDEVADTLPADLDGIVLELTENETADAPELAAVLEDLRVRGALIAVDDAGAGHAGLQQLMSVRPDIVKLDRGLVDGVSADPGRAALIECFVAFARRTGTDVCAEGIEAAADLAALAALGARYGQGYVLAGPTPGWGGVDAGAVVALEAAVAG
jgi:diguanylate cyclase (GGDEF)-like protein